jgi:hypothetical protein
MAPAATPIMGADFAGSKEILMRMVAAPADGRPHNRRAPIQGDGPLACVKESCGGKTPAAQPQAWPPGSGSLARGCRTR